MNNVHSPQNQKGPLSAFMRYPEQMKRNQQDVACKKGTNYLDSILKYLIAHLTDNIIVDINKNCKIDIVCNVTI